jgi:hypothetical protein
VIVLLDTDGIVVQDADELDAVRLRSELPPDALGSALLVTGSGALVDDRRACLDLAVLRSRAELLATDEDWGSRWALMVDRAAERGELSADQRSVLVTVEP